MRLLINITGLVYLLFWIIKFCVLNNQDIYQRTNEMINADPVSSFVIIIYTIILFGVPFVLGYLSKLFSEGTN